MEGDDGVGLDDGLHDRVPVRPVPQGRQPDLVRSLWECHRGEAAFGVAADLGDGKGRVGEVGDPERNDAVGVARVPLLEEPVVPRPDAGQAQVTVPGVEEDAATEARDHGREVHRGPDAVDVHVVHAGVDVVATRSHLVEAERLEAVGLRSPARHGVHPHLGVPLALELPHLMPLGRLDDAGGAVGQRGGKPVLERVGRLDDVVVHRDHRVAHLPRLGLGQEQIVDRHRPEYARGIPGAPASDAAPSTGRGWILGQTRKGGGVLALVIVSTFVVSGARHPGDRPVAEPCRHPALAARARRGRRRPRRRGPASPPP